MRPRRADGRRRRLMRRARRRAIFKVTRKTSASWSGENVEKSRAAIASSSEAAGTPTGSSPVSPSPDSCQASSASVSRPARSRPGGACSGSAGGASASATRSASVTARQNASNARSKVAKSSDRDANTERRPVRISSRSVRSRCSSARTPSMTCSGVTGSPWRRSSAAKRTIAAPRLRLTSGCGQQRPEPGPGDLGAEPLDVVRVLEHGTDRLAHDRLVEVIGVQGRQRLRPVERLRDAGDLGEPHPAQRLHEPRDLAGEALVERRHLELDDPDLFVEVRIVDPQVEAASAERVGQLARAVGGEHDVRWVRGLDGPDLRDRHLPIREDLEHEGLQLFVASVDFVDEEDGRLIRLRDRLQQRTAEQEVFREYFALFVGEGPARRLVQLDVQDLLLVVPLVERGRRVETFVALQPDQVRPEHARHHLRDLGLADAAAIALPLRCCAARSAGMTVAGVSGWSPSATRAAAVHGLSAAAPTAIEEPCPSCGRALTAKRTARPASASRTAGSSCPVTTTQSLTWGSTSSTLQRTTGLPLRSRSSLWRPMRRAQPAAETMAA